jgi:hypothetical protein
MPRTLNGITFGARGKHSERGSSSILGDRLAPGEDRDRYGALEGAT